MEKTFSTTCPHCGEKIDVPYKHAMAQMGKKSAAPRKGNSSYMKKLVNKRWDKVKGEKTRQG